MRRGHWRYIGFNLLAVVVLALAYYAYKIDRANWLEREKHNGWGGKPATQFDVSYWEDMRDECLADARHALLVAVAAGLFGLGALIVSTTWINPPPKKRKRKPAEAGQPLDLDEGGKR